VSVDPVSQYLSSIGRKGGKARFRTMTAGERLRIAKKASRAAGGASKEGPRKGSMVRTYLIVMLACTAGTTAILGLSILGLRRLLALVREQKVAENLRKPLHVCKLP
jgi:hypothetical protein